MDGAAVGGLKPGLGLAKCEASNVGGADVVAEALALERLARKRPVRRGMDRESDRR